VSPTPAIVGQTVTLRGNCTVAGVPAAVGSEVWTVPIVNNGNTTLTRPLAAPPLSISFADAGTKTLTVQLNGANNVLSAPFGLQVQVQGQNNAVLERTGEVAAPQQRTAQAATRTQLATVTNRLRYLRSQSGTPAMAGSVSTPAGSVSTSSASTSNASASSTSSNSSSDSNSSDGSSSKDAPSADATRTGRLGVYIASGYESGKQGASTSSGGFKTRTTGATVGADYRLTAQWVVGAGLGRLNTLTRLTNSTGRQSAKGTSATVYASWAPSEQLYFDAAVSSDRNRYEVKRDDITGSPAFGRTRGKGLGVTVSGGYDTRLGNWQLSAYGRGEMVDVRIQAFDEFGSTNSLQLGAQRAKASNLTLGGQAQLPLGTAWGVFTPHARIELTRLLDEQQNAVQARLLNSSTVLLVESPGGRTDTSYGTVALGVSAQLRRGISLFVDAETGFGQSNYRVYRVNSGLKLEL
jgi:large repetitive protein